MRNTLIIILAVFLTACTPKPEIMWINSYQVDCAGVGPMRCLLVQRGETLNEGEWQNFYTKIEGFDFEPGFIYKLSIKEEVVENPPADASSIKYSLVEVLEKKADPRYQIMGIWDAVKINGSTIKQTRIRGAGMLPRITIDLPKMSVRGMDGCNTLVGDIKSIGAEAISFGSFAQTKRMCPDMTISQLFTGALSQVKQYSVEGDQLILWDEDGSELLRFQRGVEAKVLIHDIWVAELVGDLQVKDPETAPRLEINSEKLMAMGTDGCNNFTGKLTQLTNTEIKFGVLAGTRKMFADMSIADEFNALLPEVTQYKIGSMKLSLLDADGKLLMLLKKVD